MDERKPAVAPPLPWNAISECWRYRWWYALALGITTTAVYALTSILPQKYYAQAMISDESVETDILLGLDNMSAWLKQMQNDKGEGINDPEVYAQILKSEDFAEKMGRVYLKGLGKSYYAHISETRQKSILNRIFLLKDKDTDSLLFKKNINAIQKNIQYNFSPRYKTIKIQTEDIDAETAAIMADSAIAILKQMLLREKAKVNEALQNAALVRENAKENYYSAQKQYSDYYDTHYHLSSPIAISKIDALEKERDNAFSLYNRACVQYLRAEALARKESATFTVLQKPTVPLKHSSPNKTAWILSSLFIVTLFLTWTILIRKKTNWS